MADIIYDGNRRRATDCELDASFAMCPKYDKHELTDDQIEDIAERAAKKAVDFAKADFYQDVGQTVVNKFYWIIGLILVGSFSWLASKGFIKL